MRDPYSVLGLSKTASDAEIKKAYRKLAKELHPDANPGDEKVAEKFKEVSAAYALLSNKEMRARYDRGEINADGSEKGFARYQHAGAETGGFSPFGDSFDPEEIFSTFFGGGMRGRRGPRPQKGNDRIYRVNIDFLDAVKGSKKRLTLENNKTLNVTIPPNVKEGQQIRLKGQGGPGIAGGPAGDALVEIHITPHPYFTRQGNDIHLDLPITLHEAVLGGKVTVPTIDGSVSLNIPPGTSSGKVLRLKGKGAQDSKTGQKGDQYVKVMIVLPDKIDSELQDAIKKWGKGKNYEVRSKLK
ncbi:DnaJ C-terminal domain-containing protein [Luteithermobacter gelatinilyticus]|uniref:DnaJ C-terminal domain-containing protein n=1 Tax=Luteithermobacter gelatinilyticus TaxID=2582913 RepID=UPI0011067DBD|nr:J domain-containing protein [Luteithermobacter gelatinilyticus]|tara:strand:+ start:5010 stop:5906 length:897 start_codon:yes stop_codon:yes gene_type:complete